LCCLPPECEPALLAQNLGVSLLKKWLSARSALHETPKTSLKHYENDVFGLRTGGTGEREGVFQHAGKLRQRCQEKDVSTQGRPWLDALRRLKERALNKEKRNTNTVLSSVEENPESPLQRGDKSARSSTPSPDGEETCGVNTLQPRHRSPTQEGRLRGPLPGVRGRPRGPARDRTPSRALVRRIERRRSSQRRVRQTTTVLGGEDCDLLFMLLLSNRNENDLEYRVMQQD
jgi:hypothetical protein